MTIDSQQRAERFPKTCQRWNKRVATCLLPALMGAIFLWVFIAVVASAITYGQATTGSYTVQSGDTLFTIAQRFGVTVESIVTINQIADPSLIAVGQVLLIPGAEGSASVAALGRIEARPGATLGGVALRYGLAPDVLTTLNAISITSRLFPGQPVLLPVAAPLPALRFGAVREIIATEPLIQGRAGQLWVRAQRPIALTATWIDRPLVFTQALTDSLQQTAYLPVHALQTPAPYSLTITYTAANGLPLVHQQWLNVGIGTYESQQITLPDEKGELLAPDTGEAEFTKLNALWSQASPTLWWSGFFTRPMGIEYATTSPFGTRRTYNGGSYAATSYHSGQDFGAPAGVPILAPADGVIVLTEPLQVRGNAIVIDHGHGIFTGYWHLSESKVTVGQAVKRGDVLGLVGTTGLSTGAHLHWELRIYGIAVDPMQFLVQ
jgi:murein DD-endopeptidase MepM/ murein hydrolase activator NlpD